jgi:uncharacterized membrane protein YGL010W
MHGYRPVSWFKFHIPLFNIYHLKFNIFYSVLKFLIGLANAALMVLMATVIKATSITTTKAAPNMYHFMSMW